MRLLLKRILWHSRLYLHRPRPEDYSEIDLLHKRLTKGNNDGRVMIDVGAQFGESFAPFLLFDWRVIAFEPDPDLQKQRALAGYGGPRVKIVQRALAEQPKKLADFFVSSVSTGISTLAPFHESHRAVAKVEVSTLAVEIERFGLSRVDLLKIDTEGYDFFVLKGFPWANPNLRPRAVLCEFEDGKTRPLGYTWIEMAEFLTKLGYSILVSEWHPILRYGTKHRWHALHRYPTNRVNPEGWGNLIALSDSDDVAEVIAAAAKYSRP